MGTKTWYPFSEISTLRDKVNLVLDESSRIEYSKMADPTVNIYEKEEELFVRVSLPKIDVEKVEVLISEESILIQSDDRYDVMKSISLPTKVDYEKAKTELDEGMIKVTIPKSNK